MQTHLHNEAKARRMRLDAILRITEEQECTTVDIGLPSPTPLWMVLDRLAVSMNTRDVDHWKAVLDTMHPATNEEYSEEEEATPSAAVFDPEYNKAMRIIEERVHRRVGENCSVIFSAYEEDENDVPIPATLNKVPIKGAVIFERQPDGWCSDRFETSLYSSPTWLEICSIAERMIGFTGDRHHVYLEGVRINRQLCDGTDVAELIMGS